MKYLAAILILLGVTVHGQTVGTCVTNGLVGWWLPFGTNASGTDVYDFSGQRNNGVTTNAPVWTNAITGTTNGLNFNGVNQAVFTTNKSDAYFSNATFTVCFWQKVSASVSLAAVAKDGYLGGWAIFAGNFIEAISKKSGGLCVDSYSTSSALNDSAWHFVSAKYTTDAAIQGNNSVVIYVDAVTNQASMTVSGTYLPSANLAPSIGCRNLSSAQFFNGQLADVRIYNRGLTTNEIQMIYQEGQRILKLYIGQPIGLFNRLATQ